MSAILRRSGPPPPTKKPVQSIVNHTLQLNTAEQKFSDYARQFCNLSSPIAGTIPVVGTPLKAAIDTLLVVLNGLNVSLAVYENILHVYRLFWQMKSENRQTVDDMIQRLRCLEASISLMPAASAAVQHRNEELVRKLNAIPNRLKGMNLKSIFGSADVKGAILNCIKDIDALERDYALLALMRTEKRVEEIVFQIPNTVEQGTVFVKDPTAREYKLRIEQCVSRELFIRVLRCYFGQTDQRDKILHSIIERDAYVLYTETKNKVRQLNTWRTVQSGTRIIMSALIDQYRRGDRYQCPRPECKEWNDSADVKEGWIECSGCDGRFQMTNAERRTNQSKDAITDLTTSKDEDDLVNLIQIFHIRQQVGVLYYCGTAY
ncbi:hypothetical protein CVT25_007976 [Psilocybe cyanescens]|uniref:Ubiquitin-like domain-containing protein n=1 Tax=Psilocybe cyanescens TaxID=93625 RepID=A0A409XTW9_PSICY|nr:hypothetical protein CVT25_007976 [Psilocybe cyanescens]